MYTYQESVAETLQDSMLPHIAPRMAGCDIATRYLPVPRRHGSGPWFDWVKLPGSRTALVVGDVMATASTRPRSWASCVRRCRPWRRSTCRPPNSCATSTIWGAQRLGEHYLATCLYAVYDPIAGQLQIANAGDIPPVLVRAEDGRSELLDLPTGAPIGVGGVPFEAVRVPVRSVTGS